MKPSATNMDSGRPAIRVVADAVCDLEDGDKRNLYAARFSLVDIFILAMRIPPIGTVLKVTLHPFGLDPLPPVEALVVSTVFDPSDARMSGFGALIMSMDDETLEAFESALAFLGQDSPAKDRVTGPRFERRRSPRVSADFKAHVVFLGGKLMARVTDLSMTGAMVSLDSRDIPSNLPAGTLVQVCLFNEWTSEIVSVTGKVVRRMETSPPAGLGVRFVGVDDVATAMIEDMILRVLGNAGEIMIKGT
ncbi:MAG: PilZ domain-containing protein [Deltaproteobacteria bacterium]|nr:PilZ domain-containing protein [Deltaproteobacteria bacterium]